ncbi:hydrolase, HAD-superfamily, subfamily IIIA [Chloroherpeton thalassium ATCC 35110]|uniref:D,D-heptose 1,7-bisphosphate phosphatase n=1 Tax=Chloroherpeton thalassium (strain ATCC 35110 / GB-78) TaxID=517418 RepID=B3QST4_CHLT3|nr:HAD-IIIA family hydrolase [Chloroherpeton thalassium]ACF14131.1 hydrolase, HAD-superfamily, subfamily IIIA [Chloroherpeton thalassium ATCC 35110]
MSIKAKVLFLDRDGTINEDLIGGYVTELDQFRLIPKSDEAIALARKAGFKIVIVSNQACLAKGMASEEKINAVNAYMQSLLIKNGASYDLCYFAPYHPKYPHPKYDAYKSWRKPETGMVAQALQDFQKMGLEVDKNDSYFIGDKQVDVLCGKRSGLRQILVRTGHGEVDACREKDTHPEFIADDLYDAVANYILPKYSGGNA